jgi:hypothetical protein
MGFEHYYQFIDRAVVDPLVALTWRQFHKKYGWTGGSQWSNAAEFLADFALDPPPEDVQIVERILATRTLRWTLRHSSSQYFCLIEGMVVHVPAIEKRCPGIQTSCLDEVALFLAAAVHGFLEGTINQRTLWAVFALHGCANQVQWLNLPRKQRKIIRKALAPSPLPRPMFSWQDEDCLDGEHFPLGQADTRRFLRFLRRAWEEDWPCRYLEPDIRLELSQGRLPTIRDCKSAETLLAKAPCGQGRRPCILWFFG